MHKLTAFADSQSSDKVENHAESKLSFILAYVDNYDLELVSDSKDSLEQVVHLYKVCCELVSTSPFWIKKCTIN